MKITYSAAQHVATYRNPNTSLTFTGPTRGFTPAPQHNLALMFATMQSLNSLFQAFNSFAAPMPASPAQQAPKSQPVGYSPMGEPRDPSEAIANALSMIQLGQGNHNGIIVHPNGPNGMWVVSWQSGGGHTTVHVDPKSGDGKVMYGDQPVGPTVAAYEVKNGQATAAALPKPSQSTGRRRA